jgi:hypothetical protein
MEIKKLFISSGSAMIRDHKNIKHCCVFKSYCRYPNDWNLQTKHCDIACIPGYLTGYCPYQSVNGTCFYFKKSEVKK